MSHYSVALTGELNERLCRHLIRRDGQEDLCFAVWRPSDGLERRTGLISQLILPTEGERRVHGNASFMPAYFERALGMAVEVGAGLAFFHSHPTPGWQGMSTTDVAAEASHAAAVFAATNLPFLGLTVGTDGSWSARFWLRVAPRRYEHRWVSHVRVVGEELKVTYNAQLLPPPRPKEALRRTISAWGEEAQAHLARLRIGVVGAGSVGSLVAEALARTGVRHLVLIDFDTVEEVNLDRLLHASLKDVGRSKVSVLAEGLKHGATADGFEVDEIEYSVTEDRGYRAALDCDVIFSCVDRPWPRQVLNFIAYTHLIPIVDGGVRVESTKEGRLRSADWRAHVAAPGRPCLECLGQFDPGLVPVERAGLLDDPTYIERLAPDHPLRRNENVFAFAAGAANLEVLQFLMMTISPCGVSNPGPQWYHFVPGFFEPPSFEGCRTGCPYSDLFAQGDHTGIHVTGKHHAAVAARESRLQKLSSPRRKRRA